MENNPQEKLVWALWDFAMSRFHYIKIVLVWSKPYHMLQIKINYERLLDNQEDKSLLSQNDTVIQKNVYKNSSI